MRVSERLRLLEAGNPGPQVRARVVTVGDNSEVGYYVTRDHGQTWRRVHRPTFWIARALERWMR